MIMKKLKYFIILFFVISCGYTPIYQANQNGPGPMSTQA